MKALAGRTVPAGPFIWGSSILDMVGGAFGLMGLSDYQPTTDLRASSYIYTRFDDIDYTHSLLAASLISILAGVAFHKLGGYSQKSSVYGALASLGHWLFDSLVINKRLALYPRSNYHFGLGAYTSFPIGSWVAETLFCLFAGLVAQVRRFEVVDVGSGNKLIPLKCRPSIVNEELTSRLFSPSSPSNASPSPPGLPPYTTCPV